MGSTVIEPIIEQVKIREASAVEIISLVDNSVDFLSPTTHKQVKTFTQWARERYGQEWLNTHTQFPFAEHGFSVLVRIFGEGKSSSILFDTGSSPEAIIENTKRMGISLNEIECIVMSHGHYDHCGGLLSAVKAIRKPDLPIIVHQDMFRSRGTTLPDGTIRKFTEFPTQTQLSSAQAISTKQPILITNNMICVTGEIPRKISYEKGMMRHRAFIDGIWQSDPLIMDDRAIVINVRGKGLVVISGCAHAGIINTIIYAQQITAVEKVYAVIGGFHLAGKDFEERIEPTIKELLRLNPDLIVPSHCTGWRAMCAIAKAFPDAFVWNSVGNLYQLIGLRQ